MPPSETTPQTTALTDRKAWKELAAHAAELKSTTLKELFAQDPNRGPRYTLEAEGLLLDYSKNRMTDQTLKLLVALAEEVDLKGRTEAMFTGEKINITEDRAVLHTALRAPKDAVIDVDGQNVVPAVHEVLDRMSAFSEKIRNGDWKGYTGKPIKNIVNVGIGGSDLGPVMAYEALRHYSERNLTFRFVSNVDGTDFAEATRDLDPAETLFLIASKTFTTLETMTNANTARDLVSQLRRPRRRDRQTLRRPLDRRRKGLQVRHRHREHVPLLGLGRRALLDGLCHWSEHHAGHRA